MRQGKAGLSSMALSMTVRSSAQLLTSHLEPPKLLTMGPEVQSIGAVWATASSGRQTAITTISICRLIGYSSFCGAYKSRIVQTTSIEECFAGSTRSQVSCHQHA